MPLVLIKNFPNRAFAELASQTLKTEGIPSCGPMPRHRRRFGLARSAERRPVRRRAACGGGARAGIRTLRRRV